MHRAAEQAADAAGPGETAAKVQAPGVAHLRRVAAAAFLDNFQPVLHVTLLNVRIEAIADPHRVHPLASSTARFQCQDSMEGAGARPSSARPERR